jgi:hypothetical protein
MTKFSDCQLEQMKDLFNKCFETKFEVRSETKSNDREETKTNEKFDQLNESMGLLVRLHRANRAHDLPNL